MNMVLSRLGNSMPCEMRPSRLSLRASACGWTPLSRSLQFNVRFLYLFPFAILTNYQHSKRQTTRQACKLHSLPNFTPVMYGLVPPRPSPYPPNRFFKITTISPEKTTAPVTEVKVPTTTPVLRQVPVNVYTLSVAPSIGALKPFSPLAVDIEPKRENAFGLAPNVRPRVGSTARRTALGWSKRSTGKASTDQKENVVGNSSVMTCVSFLSTHFLYLLAFRPGDNLRLKRPRPKGRPTPGG